MNQSQNTIQIFLSPSGFIELHYEGAPTNKEIAESFKKLSQLTKKQSKDNKPILLLVDVRNVGKYDFLSHESKETKLAAVKAMKETRFERAAIFGPTHLQVLVATLALVTNKRDKVRVFDNRILASRWLLNG
jgi:late competence protein required for DNA uptake (superfamily II DNA/RNA helicase)